MNIIFYILIILILGYASVYLREGWLQLKWITPLTWLGIFIHESAHALACIATGGTVTGFRVTAKEGYITHYRPKVPIIGPMVTAVAPMIFGLVIIGILDHFWLKTTLGITSASIWDNLLKVLTNLNPLHLSGWVLIILLLNIGVMMGPSIEDLKSIWPLIVLTFFVQSNSLAKVLSLVIALMAVNVLLFLAIIITRYFVNKPHITFSRT